MDCEARLDRLAGGVFRLDGSVNGVEGLLNSLSGAIALAVSFSPRNHVPPRVITERRRTHFPQWDRRLSVEIAWT